MYFEANNIIIMVEKILIKEDVRSIVGGRRWVGGGITGAGGLWRREPTPAGSLAGLGQWKAWRSQGKFQSREHVLSG